MSRNSTARLVLAVTVLVLLHYTVRPALGWRASIDFLLIAVMLIAVRVRPGVAALVGFVSGLMADAQSPANLGSAALGLVCVAFAASFLKASFFSEKSSLNITLIFLGKLAYDMVYMIAERGMVSGGPLTQLLIWSPLAAAFTAIASSLTFAFLRPLLRESRT